MAIVCPGHEIPQLIIIIDIPGGRADLIQSVFVLVYIYYLGTNSIL